LATEEFLHLHLKLQVFTQ